MTMAFRTVAAALNTLLANEAAGRYRVVGFQQQGVSADEIEDSDRVVQAYYESGDFPKSAGSVTGSRDHTAKFSLDLMVSAGASVDLSVIDNPASTPAQISTALAAQTDAGKRANDSWDELADIVYQEVSNATQRDLGLAFKIGTPWIESIQKDSVLPRGEFVTLTGVINYTCRLEEAIEGETPVAAPDGVDTILVVYSDQTGATVDNDKAGALVK
jgi:hypothetical protein